MVIPLDEELNATRPLTGDTMELDKDDPNNPGSELFEGGLCHVEVLSWRVAPTTIVVVLVLVGWAEVGSGDDDGGRGAYCTTWT